VKGCLGGCGKREERERERGECLNMDGKEKPRELLYRYLGNRVKRFVQMKINEHLIFNLTNAVRKCITLNIKAHTNTYACTCTEYVAGTG
jgi:hypothetical protein